MIWDDILNSSIIVDGRVTPALDILCWTKLHKIV